jgi:hypothetical protein
VAAAPGATVNKDEDRCSVAFGTVNIEPLDFGRSIREALGLADAVPRQFAVPDTALDQLLAVRRIGSLIISRVECGLVVVEEYRRAFFGHQASAICAGLGRSAVTRGEV